MLKPYRAGTHKVLCFQPPPKHAQSPQEKLEEAISFTLTHSGANLAAGASKGSLQGAGVPMFLSQCGKPPAALL